jgi:hypothetical protein
LLVVDAVVVMLLDDIKIMSFLFVSIRHSLRDDSTKRADRKKKGARSCTLNCLIFFTSACTACILGDVSEPSDTKIGNIHHAKKIYNDVKKKIQADRSLRHHQKHKEAYLLQLQ